jgi:hypothetical protein
MEDLAKVYQFALTTLVALEDFAKEEKFILATLMALKYLP